MNKKYGGLVSNPRNTKDTQVVKSITYTTNGTVVETVNLNAWPAATESDTPAPTPGLYHKKFDSKSYVVNEKGELAWVEQRGAVSAIGYNSGSAAPTVNFDSQLPRMAKPLRVISGANLETFTYLSWTFTDDSYHWIVSPELQELPEA